jgi:hypothetical protein
VKDVSTRVEGAEPPVILLTAKAIMAAGTACLMLTGTEESGNRWRYNLSEHQNSRLAYGKIIVLGHMAALCRALKSASAGTSPAASSVACSTPSRRTSHDLRPP